MSARGGIDLGGTKIQAIVLSDANEIIGEHREPTPREGGPPAIIAAMADAMRGATTAAGLELSGIDAVGVGAPGAVDAAAGTLSRSGNLDGWVEATVPLCDLLSAQVDGLPVRLGNDVSVAVQAEVALGAARDVASALGVFWGTGVGGAVIFDGVEWEGRGAAGEIGHMVVKQGGRQCPCGRRGCMEAYAGRGAMQKRAHHLHQDRGRKTILFQLMKEKGKPVLTSSVWAKALEKSDGLAHELVNEAVEAIACAAASAVNLLDLERVVLGGGLGLRLGEEYRVRLADAMQPHLFKDADPPPLVLAELGDFGGAIGAARLGL
ncbi:MAG: ROK family protein [Solirubrobacteraceae bacterium]|nr:ROK family protein [Solirubrobacteraceae bacterium]